MEPDAGFLPRRAFAWLCFPRCPCPVIAATLYTRETQPCLSVQPVSSGNNSSCNRRRTVGGQYLKVYCHRSPCPYMDGLFTQIQTCYLTGRVRSGGTENYFSDYDFSLCAAVPRLFATTSAVRPNPMQFVGNRISSSARTVWPEGGECTAFRIRSGAVHPCESGTCRSSRRTLIFRLGQGSAKFAAVSEQFKNSSFTCGHSSPLSPDSLFSIPQRRAAKRNGYEGQKTARAVRFCLPVFAVSVSLGPPSQWERGTIERTDNSHGEPRIARYFGV